VVRISCGGMRMQPITTRLMSPMVMLMFWGLFGATRNTPLVRYLVASSAMATDLITIAPPEAGEGLRWRTRGGVNSPF
jgi:hypothetical protein